MGPRVLIVGNFASKWVGTTAACEGLAMHLESRGWGVLRTSDKRPRISRLSDMLSTTWRGRRCYDVGIVEVYSGPAFIWAEAVSRLLTVLGKPCILWLHGGNLPEFASRWNRRVAALFACSSAVVAQSGYLAGILPARQGIVRLIPNPLDIDSYPFRPRSNPRPRLVWIRAFHEIYNPALAVRVASQLSQEFPDIVLTMIGPDKGDGSLGIAQELAVKLGIEQKIRFQGTVPKEEIPLWLDRADLFLNTTNVDNTPVTVQEAMACGLCVISTNVGGVPYLIEDQMEGLLVQPRDADAMADAVRQVLASPTEAAQMSQAARQRVVAMDWAPVLRRWELLLSSVIASEGVRAPLRSYAHRKVRHDVHP